MRLRSGIRAKAALVLGALVLGAPALVAQGETTRASVGAAGESSMFSIEADVSDDGRYVVFECPDQGLLDPPSVGFLRNAFVRDRVAGVTIQASASLTGDPSAGGGGSPRIAADGSVVVFTSVADDLVAGDTNGLSDVFAYDMVSGIVSLISFGPGGVPGDGASFAGGVSGDGTRVVFRSYASNLDAVGDGVLQHIFVHDRQTGATRAASIASDGTPANQHSFSPDISDDGSHVAFMSYATNLDPADTLGQADVFLHDIAAVETRLVSVSVSGVGGNDLSDGPSLSADGLHVAFVSRSSDLIANDTNGVTDVFVREMPTGLTKRVSLADAESEADDHSVRAEISGNGRFVVMMSAATNFVLDDVNGVPDIFVRDRVARTTRRVSTTSFGAEATAGSQLPVISADGRFIAFESDAADLVDGDTNGSRDIFVVDRGDWVDLGCSLPGQDEPLLTGSGVLKPGHPGSLDLRLAKFFSPAVLFVAQSDGSTPFMGGTLKPVPAFFVGAWTTNSSGEILNAFVTPPDVVPGLTLYAQYAILDPAAVQGVSLSNALRTTTP